MIHESYSLATTRTRGISLQGETKFTWKRKRGGACLLPTIFLSLPSSPLSVRQFPRLVKWKKNGNVSRVTLDAVAHHQEKKSYFVRPFACAPTTEMDHDKSPRDCFHAENGTVSFPKGMHRKTFIIPGYVTGSRDAAIRFAANLTSFSKGIFSF